MATTSRIEFKGQYDGGGTLTGVQAAISKAFSEARSAGAPDSVRLIHIGVYDPTVYVTVGWDIEPVRTALGETR